MFRKKWLITFIIPFLFLAISFKTIPDYGINWDDSMHFNRGQAYLHYFLTGKTNYLDLPKPQSLDESVDFKDIRGEYMPLYLKAQKSDWSGNTKRSYYQSDVFSFEYFKEKDSGHPPLNGILAAGFNYIFYQKLDVLDDLYSYQLFIVFTVFLLLLGISIFAYSLFGIFPSLLATSFLALYPLLLGESHFNIKDPVLASFFGLTLITFYFGIVKNNYKLLLLSGILAGFSLATKFNTFFLPFILIPWLLFYWKTKKNSSFTVKNLIGLVFISIIPALILFIFWPYLWFHGLEGFSDIFSYYATEGTTISADLEKYKYFGFNLFPLTWILITTPIPVLIFSIIGTISLGFKLFKERSHTSLLILLWLFVPIIRVTLPNTAIYGGVRHIMEFIPALAITSGAGAYFLLDRFKRLRNSLIILIILSIIVILCEMVRIHPNENVYFNQLVGGLSGAKQKEIPYWGNSFGNAYQQGIEWLNKNAPLNSRLGLPIGGTVNLPRMNLRSDISVSNDNFSGFNRQGEYEIEMSHDWNPQRFFTYKYLETFLNPVYEVKVDNTAILKIWKNDLSHTKEEYREEIEIKSDYAITGSELTITLKEKSRLTRVYINYDKLNCNLSNEGFISTSLDKENWLREGDSITYPQMSAEKLKLENIDFFFLFAAQEAKFIKINLDDSSSCLLKNPHIRLMGVK